MDINAKWDKIKQELKKEYELSDILYKTWIEPLDFFNVENDTVYIFTEVEEFVDYLTRKYKNPFVTSIAAVINKEYKVKFISYSDINNKEETKSKISANEYNKNCNLNKDYTFDNFIVGKNNKLAHAAAVAISENPGLADYNPFFIYAGVGLGKTHLMHAIGNHILEVDPNKKVLYTTAEDFCNEIINAIASGKGSIKSVSSINNIREKYRNADVFLIDDIQFVIGKEKTQEEFFYTFNSLIAKNKQIVISSDKPPIELDGLDNRYTSRFINGVIYEMDTPDYETKYAILNNWLETNHLNTDMIGSDILDFIAQNSRSNIRELEGCFKTIKAYLLLSGEKHISLETAKNELKKILTPDKEKEITPDLIIEFVADHYGISINDIKSKSHKKEFSKAKHVYMYLARKYTDYTLKDIAKFLGGMDHSSINYGINNVEKLLKTDKKMAKDIENITKKLNPETK